jgi:hypothetical protein
VRQVRGSNSSGLVGAQVDTKKAGAPPLNPKKTTNKTTMMMGSGGCGGGRSGAAQADAKKAATPQPDLKFGGREDHNGVGWLWWRRIQSSADGCQEGCHDPAEQEGGGDARPEDGEKEAGTDNGIRRLHPTSQAVLLPLDLSGLYHPVLRLR